MQSATGDGWWRPVTITVLLVFGAHSDECICHGKSKESGHWDSEENWAIVYGWSCKFRYHYNYHRTDTSFSPQYFIIHGLRFDDEGHFRVVVFLRQSSVPSSSPSPAPLLGMDGWMDGVWEDSREGLAGVNLDQQSAKFLTRTLLLLQHKCTHMHPHPLGNENGIQNWMRDETHNSITELPYQFKDMQCYYLQPAPLFYHCQFGFNQEIFTGGWEIIIILNKNFYRRTYHF